MLVLILGYFGIGLLVAARLSAPTTTPMRSTPEAVGIDYREVNLRSTDGLELRGWWAPRQGSSRAAVLVHGLGGNKSDEQILQTAPIYHEAGYNVLMLDLRGHGESSPARRTLGYREVRDVRGALDWLEERGFEPDEVVLHGWSMGAATTIRVAPEVGVAAVVEEAGYADLPRILRDELPENSGLPAFFNPGIMLSAKLFLDFDPWAVVPQEEAADLARKDIPFFIIHSTADETVSYIHARMFREAYPDAELWRLEGYGHVRAHTHPDYRRKLLDFLMSSRIREAA